MKKPTNIDFYDLFRSQLLRRYHKKIDFQFTPEQELYLIYTQGIYDESINEREKTKNYLRYNLLKRITKRSYKSMIRQFLRDPYSNLNKFDIEDSHIVIPVPFKHGDILENKRSMLADRAVVIDINTYHNDNGENFVFDNCSLPAYTITSSGYVTIEEIDIFNLDYWRHPIFSHAPILKLQDILINSKNYMEFIMTYSIRKLKKGY